MTNPPVRVIVVDDQPAFRRVAAEVIDITAGFVLVGEAASGEDGVRLARSRAVDLVLMDISMPGCGGLEAARRVRYEQPGLCVVLLSMYDLESLPAEITRSRLGYGDKSCFGPDELLRLWNCCRND